MANSACKRKRDAFSSDLNDVSQVKKPIIWNIDKKLTSGNYGKVYIANRLNKTSIIKEIDRHESSTMHEGKYPNIVKVNNIYLNQDSYFLELEYCKEGDLLDYMENTTLDVDVVLDIIKQLIRAVKYCHDNDIAHNDIKLENIFIKSDDDGILKVVLGDFGLARRDIDKRTHIIMGTPVYLAPEKLGVYKYYAAKSDVWAIGVCLYAMYYDRYPFSDMKRSLMIDEILNKPILPLFDIDLDSDDPTIIVKSLIKWMLSKDPEKRPTINDVYSVIC